MAEPLCIHCGLPAASPSHHEFESVSLPAGCQCDPMTWESTSPTRICEHYEGDGHCYCRTCEHGLECHGEAPPCAT